MTSVNSDTFLLMKQYVNAQLHQYIQLILIVICRILKISHHNYQYFKHWVSNNNKRSRY